MPDFTPAPLTDCALILDLDEQKYLFVSPAIKDITGYTSLSFYNNAGLLSQIMGTGHLDSIQKATDCLLPGESTTLNYPITKPGGAIVWVTDTRSLLTDEQTGHQLLISNITTRNGAAENKQPADLSFIFDNNPNPMWIYEIGSLRVVKVNKAAIKRYGYNEAEFLKLTTLNLRPASEIGKFNAYLQQEGLSDTDYLGFSNTGIWKHQNKKGNPIYAGISSHYVRFDGRDCRVVVATDVTDKIRYQEEARLREKFLNSLIDSQTNFLIRLDAKGNFVFLNKQFLKVFGYKKSDIVGKHFGFTVIPAEMDKCQAAFIACIGHPGKVINLQHKKLDKAGLLHDTEWEFISITDDAGNVTEIQGVGQDITHRLHVEKEMHRAQEETSAIKHSLEALINNTSDEIWSVDKELRYVYMNKAYREQLLALTGAEPKEGDYSYLHWGFNQQAVEQWNAYYQRALAGEHYSIVNEDIDPTTHQALSFEISFNPIYKVKGEITGVGCFARDITERLKNEQAIVDQNERLRNIASLSSHELRRPVASMLGLINLMDRANFFNPDNHEIIEHLLTVGNEIDDVIRLIVDKTFTSDEQKKYRTP